MSWIQIAVLSLFFGSCVYVTKAADRIYVTGAADDLVKSLLRGRLLPGGKKGEVKTCPLGKMVDAACCAKACDVSCSSTCVINEVNNLDVCSCDGINLPILISMVVLLNTILGLALFFKGFLPSLYRREEHLPESMRVVDKKKKMAIGLSAILGLAGAVIAYQVIASKITSNSIVVLCNPKGFKK